MASDFKAKIVVEQDGTNLAEIGDVNSYKIFTFPNCEKCKDTKEFLSKISLLGEAIDLSSPDGKQNFQKYYKDVRQQLIRDEHGLQLPVVMFFDKQGNISGVSQDLNRTKEIIAWLKVCKKLV